ncbi:MAG: bifunctional (p)ppGpp synthetase/guanosine-3',5'-bis(diphosphate) 3'-pyrophosphohydrolase [Chloroflexi bacterium]|nr:bifunctional (p)ppGpp synthetase/guanosine-3',5'-bis(diphosphate) 3'-pyrophosphohydrolase [Chloroflexota bacterium]
MAAYGGADDVALVRRAHEFAEIAHAGQVRQSGEPYISHPVQSAFILADLHLEATAIAAALLHDVPEDTGVSLDEVRRDFGDEVARLVDGVTKLGRLERQSRDDGRRYQVLHTDDEAAAETVRKMFLAMAEDLRVVLIKLADRLHNMRTLDALPELRRRAIAQETMEIYAPLAGRLGIWQIKWQLEDLAFRHLEPERYREIAALLQGRRGQRELYIARVIAALHEELAKAGVRAVVSGRPKHIFSIARKMQRRGVDFHQIYDLLAVRVLVDEVADCYHALGVIHTLWRPIPGQFDDYIAMPKESMYQSLHTTMIGPEGQRVELQIRTHDMHRTAEYGVAAHWRYKEGGKRDVRFEEKIAWLRQLIGWQKELAGAHEFVESLKTDIFRDQVFVFTPRGEVKELPAGATPIDFAYRVHTEVGHRCIGAKANGRLVPLDTPLRTGDIVEILTAKGAKGPSRDWLTLSLGYVKTANARDKIRQWFRRQQRDENVVRGRELLERELLRLGLQDERPDEIAKFFKFEKVEDLYLALGCGDLSTHQIAQRVAQRQEQPALPEAAAPTPQAMTVSGITVMGVGDMLTRLARCCSPVPGDEIVGYITRGRGVSVHRATCPSVMGEDERERLVPVEWGRSAEQVYPVTLRIEALDRVGLLRDVAGVVAEERLSMSAVNTNVLPDTTALIQVSIAVPGIERLSRLIGKIEGIKNVYSVTRELSRGDATRRDGAVRAP